MHTWAVLYVVSTNEFVCVKFLHATIMVLLTLLHMDLYVYLDSYKLYVLKVPTSLDLMYCNFWHYFYLGIHEK